MNHRRRWQRTVRVDEVLRVYAVNNFREHPAAGRDDLILHTVEPGDRLADVIAADGGPLARIVPEQLVVLEEIAGPLLVSQVIQVELKRSEYLGVLLVVFRPQWEVFLCTRFAGEGKQHSRDCEQSD